AYIFGKLYEEFPVDVADDLAFPSNEGEYLILFSVPRSPTSPFIRPFNDAGVGSTQLHPLRISPFRSCL
ncbi:MAG: hypothetical protein WAN86_16200, partial [Hyphomicrobiaceae bacterium]